MIADYRGPVDDPAELAARLSAIPGVVEHGLFPPDLVNDVLIGRGDRAETPASCNLQLARLQPSARSRLNAALIRARCVNACGKLPSGSPVGPISSA